MKAEIRAVLVEAAIVAVGGFGLALAANQISPRGLDLSRNYFPTGTNKVVALPMPVQTNGASVATNEPTEADQLSERLRGKGLLEVKRSQVESLLRDPRARDGRVIFIDARDEDHYNAGHLPGAYELDPYHPERQLGTVMPACQAAEKIVVYCTGGECEDADTTAILLGENGIPGKKIFVYGGGFAEWDEAHLPLEAGARNSGTPVLHQ